MIIVFFSIVILLLQGGGAEAELLNSTAGVLITGGYGSSGALNTVEIYRPSSGDSCLLPHLPQGRYHHTVERSGLLCGGSDTEYSCLQWASEQGAWEETISLEVERREHVSWTPGLLDTSTYLMAGYYGESRTTATLIKPDGSQEPGFPLKYDTRYVYNVMRYVIFCV